MNYKMDHVASVKYDYCNNASGGINSESCMLAVFIRLKRYIAALILFIIGCICIAASLYLTVQANAAESPEVRALTLRVGSEINSSIQCATQAFAIQDKLTAVEAEVKRLTDKYEPKPTEPAK